MKYEEVRSQVFLWALERKLLNEANKRAQMCKVTEEVGELAGAILKNDREAMMDAFGDVLVTLTILAHQVGMDEVGCFEQAYETIKDRKGRTEGGTFIKEV